MKRVLGNKMGNEEPIDLSVVFKSLVKHWYLFIICVIIFLGLAFLYLRIATPVYEISGSVIIKEGDRPTTVAESSVLNELDNLKTSIKLENEIEKLKSKSLMNEAVISNKAFIFLYDKIGFFKKEISPFSLPVEIEVHEINNDFVGGGELLQIHLKEENKFELILEDEKKAEFEFNEKIRTNFGVFSLVKKEEEGERLESVSSFVLNFVNPVLITEQYSKSLTLEQPSIKSSTIYLTMLNTSPARGKDIMSSVINGYNFLNINQKNEVALKTINFIDERLALAREELNQVERDAEQYKQRNRITDIGLDSRIFLESTQEMRKEISDISSKIEILESLENLINSQSSQGDLIPSSLVSLDPALGDLLTRYNDLQRDRQRLSRVVQPNNQQILSLNEQISSLRSNIIQNISSTKRNLQIRNNNLVENLDESTAKVQRIPAIERELMEIDRQKSIKQEHYQFLLKKREESALALEMTGVNSLQIIDPPSASVSPVKPNRIIVLGIGFVFGLIFPLGLIFLKTKLSTNISSKKTVESFLNVPILGEVGKNEENGVIAITPKSITPPAEQLRLIRSNLNFQSGKDNQVIAISSSMSQEGKTFMSINLALSLSLVEKKVVLVDFDLRRPSVLKSLKYSAEKSLNDFFNNSIRDFKRLIIPSEINQNLHIIGVNEAIENPSEIINSKKIGELLDYLKANYDHIIIDTSPIGLVADAYSLSDVVDMMIFIVRMNFTKEYQLEAISEIIDKKIFKQHYVIINDSEKQYGKKFGYGYYATKKKEEEKKNFWEPNVSDKSTANPKTVSVNPKAVPENSKSVPENSKSVPANSKAVPANSKAVPANGSKAVPEKKPLNNPRIKK
jgi:tyrosine-protein kinase Etk/Wzc